MLVAIATGCSGATRPASRAQPEQTRPKGGGAAGEIKRCQVPPRSKAPGADPAKAFLEDKGCPATASGKRVTNSGQPSP